MYSPEQSWGNKRGLHSQFCGDDIGNLWFKSSQKYEIDGSDIRLYIDSNSRCAHVLFQLVLAILCIVFLLVEIALTSHQSVMVAVLTALTLTAAWLHTIRSIWNNVLCFLVVLICAAVLYFAGISSAYLFICVSVLLLGTWLRSVRRSRVKFSKDMTSDSVTAEVIIKHVYSETVINYAGVTRVHTCEHEVTSYFCPISIQPEQFAILISHTGSFKRAYGPSDSDVYCGSVFSAGRSLEALLLSVNTLCKNELILAICISQSGTGTSSIHPGSAPPSPSRHIGSTGVELH